VIIPSGYAQVNLLFSGAQVPEGGEVTFGVDPDVSVGGPFEVGVIVATHLDGNNLPALLTADTLLPTIRVKFGPNDVGPSSEFSYGGQGSDTSDGVQPQVSVLTHKHTAFGGRAGRGRAYWPGAPEDRVGGSGALEGAYVTAWQTFLDGFISDMETSLCPVVLLHAAGSPLSTPTPLTGWTVDARVATQRRRNRR